MIMASDLANPRLVGERLEPLRRPVRDCLREHVAGHGPDRPATTSRQSLQRHERSTLWFQLYRRGGRVILHHGHIRPVLIRDWSRKMDGIAATIWASQTTLPPPRSPKRQTESEQPPPPSGRVNLPTPSSSHRRQQSSTGTDNYLASLASLREDLGRDGLAVTGFATLVVDARTLAGKLHVRCTRFRS